MEIFRIRNTGEIYRPYRNKSGLFVMADPKFGREKHHAKNEVMVETLSEVRRRIVEDGFHLWMKGEVTGQQNLISPKSIVIK